MSYKTKIAKTPDEIPELLKDLSKINMLIEAPFFIRTVIERASQSTANFLRERASKRRNVMSDAGLTSALIFLGAGIGGVITGNMEYLLIAVYGGPLSLVATTGAEMVYDTKQYSKRERERARLDGLQYVIGLWKRAAETAPPDHYQLHLL